MPLKLEIKRVLSARSERVKSVDVHPTEPWVVAGLYTGHLYLWNYQTETLVKSFQVCEPHPIRTAKFIPRKQWIVCAADNMHIYVYNYNTMEKLQEFEAHSDYIRSLAVHPHQPYVISCSDDMTIRVWDWERNWAEKIILEGHTHYIMQVAINPKDPSTFASASLDRTIKVWGLNSTTPHFSLEGHERGINCVSYCNSGDRPYLISGSDDQTIRVWDYQTKACVAVLEGHDNNVSAVMYHPTLPIILSGSEDGTVRMWHSSTFRLENILNYGMERVWGLCGDQNSTRLAIAYDDGTVVVQMGQEDPVVSMDKSGKVVFARNHELLSANVRMVGNEELVDGERLPLATKDLGSAEVYPQTLAHDPKGRVIAVCGDGEYTVYMALKLQNKHYGSALEFVWSAVSGVFATRESPTRIKIYKNYEEHMNFKPAFPAEGIFGGSLLGVRSQEFIDFYEWEEMRIVRRIEICPKKVFWSESGQVVALCGESSFYILRLNTDLISKYLEQGIEVGEQGIDDAFVLEKEIGEKVTSGNFVGDCFIYTNSSGRLNYYVGGQVLTLAHLDKEYSLLGYLPKMNRVYLCDKQFNVISYQLLLAVLLYQTAIVRDDLEFAAETLSDIPVDFHNRIAKFLDSQGLKNLALTVSKDSEHRFELALQLNEFDLARSLAEQEDSTSRWKQLGDVALSNHSILVAKECYYNSEDLGGLMLIATSYGDEAMLSDVAQRAKSAGRFNVAFACLFALGRKEDCLELLIDTKRISEAAFFARTYIPSAVTRVVGLWRKDLQSTRPKIAEALADPESDPHMFANYDIGLQVEGAVGNSGELPSASAYEQLKGSNKVDLIQAAIAGGLEEYLRNKATPEPSLKASPVSDYAEGVLEVGLEDESVELELENDEGVESEE